MFNLFFFFFFIFLLIFIFNIFIYYYFLFSMCKPTIDNSCCPVEDLVKDVLVQDLGATIHFARVFMKPGFFFFSFFLINFFFHNFSCFFFILSIFFALHHLISAIFQSTKLTQQKLHTHITTHPPGNPPPLPPSCTGAGRSSSLDCLATQCLPWSPSSFLSSHSSVK